MIKVSRAKNEIKIDGHALYDDFGKDIVCASASSIVITTINACLMINDKSISYEEDNPLIIRVLINDKVILKLIDNMMNLLSELAHDYPKNIKIL